MNTLLIPNQDDYSNGYDSVYEYSVSYYDYVVNDGCSGFGWNLENHTYDSLKQTFVNTDTMIILTLLIQPLCAFFGVISNLAFMYIVWKVPYMRTNMNIVLLNLALADLIYLGVGSLEKFLNVFSSPVMYDSQVFGGGDCWLIIPLLDVASVTSLLLIALLSVERYIAICKPLVHRRISTRRRTLKYVVLVWLIAVMVAVCITPSHLEYLTVCIKWPNLTVYESFPQSASFCTTQNNTYLSASEILQIVPFFVALILSFSCYVMIIGKLYRRSSPSTEINMAKQQRKSANAAAKMILANGLAFFILTTPFHVISAVKFFELISSTYKPIRGEVKVASGLLLYLNSVVNPYIYGLTNPMYRKAYGTLLCRFQQRRSHRPAAADRYERRVTNV